MITIKCFSPMRWGKLLREKEKHTQKPLHAEVAEIHRESKAAGRQKDVCTAFAVLAMVCVPKH